MLVQFRCHYYCLFLNGKISDVISLAALGTSGVLNIKYSLLNPPLTSSGLGRSPQHEPQHRAQRKQRQVPVRQTTSKAPQSVAVCCFASRISSISVKKTVVSRWAASQQQQQHLLGSWWREIIRVLVNAILVFGPQ